VKKTALLSATTFLFLVTGLSVTQETQTAPISRDGGVQQRLISILIPSTPNAPFTAIVHTGLPLMVVRVTPPPTPVSVPVSVVPFAGDGA